MHSSSPPAFAGGVGGGFFSDAARKLAGLATILLGWRPDEFWAATPEELATILEAMRADTPPPVDLRAMMERFPDG